MNMIEIQNLYITALAFVTVVSYAAISAKMSLRNKADMEVLRDEERRAKFAHMMNVTTFEEV